MEQLVRGLEEAVQGRRREVSRGEKVDVESRVEFDALDISMCA